MLRGVCPKTENGPAAETEADGAQSAVAESADGGGTGKDLGLADRFGVAA